MKRFIDGLIGTIFVLIALISNADAQEMTMQDELLQRQEDASRELQENQRSRADELREIQSERAEELQDYQEEAIEELNQEEVMKHRKRERRQEKVFDHRPVLKDHLHNKNYNRTRKKEASCINCGKPLK